MRSKTQTIQHLRVCACLLVRSTAPEDEKGVLGQLIARGRSWLGAVDSDVSLCVWVPREPYARSARGNAAEDVVGEDRAEVFRNTSEPS